MRHCLDAEETHDGEPQLAAWSPSEASLCRLRRLGVREASEKEVSVQEVWSERVGGTTRRGAVPDTTVAVAVKASPKAAAVDTKEFESAAAAPQACPQAAAVAAQAVESAAAAPQAQPGQLTLEQLHAAPCQLPHQAPSPLPLSGCCAQPSSGQCARPACSVHKRAQGCQAGTHQQEEATGQEVRGAGGLRKAATGGALPGGNPELSAERGRCRVGEGGASPALKRCPFGVSDSEPGEPEQAASLPVEDNSLEWERHISSRRPKDEQALGWAATVGKQAASWQQAVETAALGWAASSGKQVASFRQQKGEQALGWAQRCFAAPMLVSLPNLPAQHFCLCSESDEDTRTECSDLWQHGDSTPDAVSEVGYLSRCPPDAADDNDEKAKSLLAAMSAKAELWLLQATSSEIEAMLRD